MKKRILVGVDPLGRPLKDEIAAYLEEEGYEVIDIGSNRQIDVDYWSVGDEVGKRIVAHESERATIFCRTGMGVNIVANKFPGVYCGLCESVTAARLCRTINDYNVLPMGALVVILYKTKKMVKAFLETPFTKNSDLCEPTLLEEVLVQIKNIEKCLYHDCQTLWCTTE